MPDKLKCFDYHLPESEIPEILAAYYDQCTKPGLRSVIEHRAFTDHNFNALETLIPLHTSTKERLSQIQSAVSEWQNSDYVDVHVWQFSKFSHYRILEFIRLSGICRFEFEQRQGELELFIHSKCSKK